MHRFYLPDLRTGTLELPSEEAHHATSVLRLRPGDVIMLLDGKGHSADAHVLTADRRGCTVDVGEVHVHAVERGARIHLAVAPTKNIDRFEWMLEKCTEMGADRITPLITTRAERTHLRADRLQKVLVSAMKQSQRAWLPQLDEPTTIAATLAQPLPPQRFFGWCEGVRPSLMKCYTASTDALVIIGPEGDFTAEEARTLSEHGFTSVSLGTARLRTETAAVMACAWLNAAQQV